MGEGEAGDGGGGAGDGVCSPLSGSQPPQKALLGIQQQHCTLRSLRSLQNNTTTIKNTRHQILKRWQNPPQGVEGGEGGQKSSKRAPKHTLGFGLNAELPSPPSAAPWASGSCSSGVRAAPGLQEEEEEEGMKAAGARSEGCGRRGGQSAALWAQRLRAARCGLCAALRSGRFRCSVL